jgi:hypothetical protein
MHRRERLSNSIDSSRVTRRYPQYLLRTDKMDYEIRPLDLKHATLLPVGTEDQFKIKD